ncbi:quinol monooxygenase YgiN [Motilibacter rhizosphaerae]|uniref:Quinol monooxygenase YgiN n=1 Tax=Motilibacter rhizosphaerae TaxID=598652 RepID=A0A4Q7NVC1_9ACTN|nr:antibiotic biosynthesis monooxygenase [Motilibacter rhizosphaerae]RZS91191.1 quinol monooxygenase YgiN [Motilibacter rhizosphaerae]
MFGIVVRFDLQDEAAAARFDALVAEVLPGIRSEEPGTLVYTTHHVKDDPLARVFYELYRDEQGHADHEARPATAAFLHEIGPLTRDVRVEFLTDVDAP